MASLYPDKQHGWRIVYYLYFFDGNKKRKHKFFRTKNKALLAQQDAEKLELFSSKQTLTKEEILYYIHKKFISRSDLVYITSEPVCSIPPREMTWDMLKKVYEQHVKTVGTEMTKATHPYRSAAVLEYFDDLTNTNPLMVKEKDISDFIDFCRNKGRAKDTINKYLSVLRVMFDFLVKENAIPENPARKIKYFRNTQQNIPRILYPGEFKNFLNKLKTHASLCRGYFPEMILAYIYTGMRRYELVYLKKENINFAHSRIKIRGKGEKERFIDIHPTLLPVLQSVLKKNMGRSGKYFFGGYNEPVIQYGEVSKAFKKFRTNAKLPEGVKLHSLRHTFISYLLAAGADLEYTRLTAGHESLKTTQRYVHLIPRQESQIKNLDYMKYIDNEPLDQ